MRIQLNRARSSLLALAAAGLAACSPAAQVRSEKPQAGIQAAALLPDEQAYMRQAGVELAELQCSAANRWSTTLRGDARFTAEQIIDELGRLGATVPADQAKEARKKVTDAVFWRLILTQILEGQLHNLGAAVLPGATLPDGRPVLLFRTGFTPDPGQPGSCVQSLIGAGVRHIVNLYAGPMPTQGLEDAEKRAVTAVGGTYFSARSDPQAGNWREDLREGDGPEAHQAAYKAVAELIRNQILRPAGGPVRGHLQLHCGGGMHRTGMIIGVIERCLGGVAMPQVAAHYKRHVGWRSDAQVGGLEPENLRFIEGFDCSLLR